MVAGLTEAPGGTAQSEPSRAARVRTAVIIVHGMGEQVPMETLNGFVRTALAPTGGQRRYFSRPSGLTDSYEARRTWPSGRARMGSPSARPSSSSTTGPA